MQKFEYHSKISIARPESKSGRTTIPKEVMKFLDLKIGDKIDWVVEVNSEEVNVQIKKSK